MNATVWFEAVTCLAALLAAFGLAVRRVLNAMRRRLTAVQQSLDGALWFRTLD